MPPTETTNTTKSATNTGATSSATSQSISADSRAASPSGRTGEGSVPVDLDTTYTGNTGSSGQGMSEEVSRQGHEWKNRARDQVRDSYEQVEQFTNEALDKAKQQWSQKSGRAQERAQQMLRDQKNRVASGIEDIASAARCAADTLEERNDHTIAEYTRSAAEALENARDYLAHAETTDLWRDASTFARRRPEWVLGGAFVAGLAIARFLKADRPYARGPGHWDRPESADPDLYRDVYRAQNEGFADDAYGELYPPMTAMDDGMGDGMPGDAMGEGPLGYEAPGTYGTGAAGGTSPAAPFGQTDPIGLDNPAGHTQDELRSPASSASTGGNTGSITGSTTGGTSPTGAIGTTIIGASGADSSVTRDEGINTTDTRNASPDDVSSTTSADTGRKGGV